MGVGPTGAWRGLRRGGGREAPCRHPTPSRMAAMRLQRGRGAPGARGLPSGVRLSHLAPRRAPHHALWPQASGEGAPGPIGGRAHCPLMCGWQGGEPRGAQASQVEQLLLHSQGCLRAQGCPVAMVCSCRGAGDCARGSGGCSGPAPPAVRSAPVLTPAAGAGVAAMNKRLADHVLENSHNKSALRFKPCIDGNAGGAAGAQPVSAGGPAAPASCLACGIRRCWLLP